MLSQEQVSRISDIALPSLSDKLTSLRGYSQRKIKVLPQTDGRGIAGIYANQGEINQAIALFQQSLELKKE